MVEEDNSHLLQKGKKTFVEMQKDIEEEWNANALGFNKHDFLVGKNAPEGEKC